MKYILFNGLLNSVFVITIQVESLVFINVQGFGTWESNDFYLNWLFTLCFTFKILDTIIVLGIINLVKVTVSDLQESSHLSYKTTIIF